MEHSTILDRCPYIKGIRAGDEGVDLCKLTESCCGNTSLCVLITGSVCETWEDIKKEDGYTERVCPGDLCDGKLDLKENKE